jgi:hypothetical protein
MMGTLDLYSLLLLGFLGTGHCIGMCGPIVLAIPAQAGKTSAHLLYHLGRITTYAGVGAFLGGIGAGVSRLLSVAGGDPLVWIARTQVAFSLLAAAVLLLLGLCRLGILREPDWMAVATPAKIPSFRLVAGEVTAGRGKASIFVLGLMMGLLPCGLSYAAFARSLAAGGFLGGGALSLCFGVGTLPGLFLLGMGASGLFSRYRRYSDLLSGMLMAGIGLSLAADATQAILS